jgi:hypothetical protein
MATYSKLALSGSTSGRPIAVSASASPGTVIHTSASASLDEIWIYAVNSSTTSVKLTLEYGGTSTADQIEITITGESGLTLIVPGLILTGSNIVRAFAATANVIALSGYVNRIT